MKKLIQNACEKMYPDQKQIEKMYKDLLDSNDSKDAKVIVVNRKKKIFTSSVAVAACAALTICLGTSIYKNAQDMKISRSGDNVDSTQDVNPTTEGVDPDENAENSDTPAAVNSLMSFSNKKCVNGKTFYIGEKGPKEMNSYFNVNLLDLTTTDSDSSVNFYSLTSGNTVYSVTGNNRDTPLELCVSDLTTGEIINKTNIDDNDYEEHCPYRIYTDNSGNVYIRSLSNIAVYSSNLELLYTLSLQELSNKLNDYTDGFQYKSIGTIAVSPEGEIYAAVSDKSTEGNYKMSLYKLEQDNNIVFISDNYNNIGSNFSNLYFSDNGNLIACSQNWEFLSDSATYIREISPQTGEIIADHGQLESSDVYGLYGNCLIFYDRINTCIGKYDISSHETEQIYYCGETVQINMMLSGDHLIIKTSDYDVSECSRYCLFISDSSGNMLKEIPISVPDVADILEGSFDVTDDEKVYYIYSSCYGRNVDENQTDFQMESNHTLCTIDSNDKPVKLFDFPTAYNESCPPSISADSNQNLYVCSSDNTGKLTLKVYNCSGEIKSTMDIPENNISVIKSILSGSELLLIGRTCDSAQPCYISVDLNTMQPGKIEIIDENSEIMSKDGYTSFSFTTDEE